MFLEKEKQLSQAERERSYESREAQETKEQELDPEAQAAAMKERADYLVKEVKNNKKMMQNILMNVQQVKQLINKIRAQLQLAQNTQDPSSVAQDQQYVEELKKQIAAHQEELMNMRDDLIRIYSEEIQENQPHLNDEEVRQQAAAFVDSIIAQTQDNETTQSNMK